MNRFLQCMINDISQKILKCIAYRKNATNSTTVGTPVLGLYQRVFRMRVIAYSLVTFILFAVLCSARAESDGPVIALQQEPNGLSSIFDSMMVGRIIQGAMFRNLVEMDDEWNYYPVLVKEIPTIDNGLWTVETNPDGSVKSMTVTWNLREDIKWEDGEPITSRDFKFAWQVVMSSDRVISRDGALLIKSIDASDPKKIVVLWKEPYAYANLGIAGLLPAHLLKEEFRRNPKEFYKHVSRMRPLANGPYRLVEWQQGRHIKLEKNPNWWGAPPKINTLNFRFLVDQESIMQGLKDGGVDAVSDLGLTMEQANILNENMGDVFEIRNDDGMAWEHIDLNFDNIILNPPGNPNAGKKVRQALFYAIDRDAINNVVYDGHYTVSHSWLPKDHYGYNAKVKKYTYDPERAAILLQEAGWTFKNEAKTLTNANGDELVLSIVTTAGNVQREVVARMLKDYWGEAGIRVSIENKPAKYFFSETMKKRRYKSMGMYAWIFGPLANGEGNWTIKNIPSEDNQWQGQNFPGFRNERIDLISSKIPRTIEKAKRVALFKRHQEIWIDELPALPLFIRSTISIYRKGWENWRPTGTALPVTWNAEMWSHPNWK